MSESHSDIHEKSINKFLCYSDNDITCSIRCRICLDTSKDEELISPCWCTGTMGLIHKSCLEHWLTIAHSKRCEVCGFIFKLKTTPPPFSKWISHGSEGSPRSSSHRKHLWTDIICLSILIPLLSLSGWLTVRASSRGPLPGMKFKWEAFALGILFVLLTTIFFVWLVMSIKYHRKAYFYWKIINSKLALDESVTLLRNRNRRSKKTMNKRVKRTASSNLDQDGCNTISNVWSFSNEHDHTDDTVSTPPFASTPVIPHPEFHSYTNNGFRLNAGDTVVHIFPQQLAVPSVNVISSTHSLNHAKDKDHGRESRGSYGQPNIRQYSLDV